MKQNSILLELFKDVEDSSIHLIVTDPPYFNVADESWDKQWSSKEEYLHWMFSWTTECHRVLVDGGAFYVFGGIGSKNGFIFWNYVEQTSQLFSFASYINWRRFRGKGYLGIHNNWSDSREDIAYFVKGQTPNVFVKQYMRESGLSQASLKRFQETGVGLACTNIWIDIPEVQLDGGMNRTLSHPCEKPVELICRIIKASTNENDIVLDCFSGSGTTALACVQLNRKYICFEKNEQYFNISTNRISDPNFYKTLERKKTSVVDIFEQISPE